MKIATTLARTAHTSMLMVLVATVFQVAVPGAAFPDSPRYEFTTLAVLGDPAPGGGTFTFDFEPGSMNNRGDVIFGADLTTGGEGMFVVRRGSISALALHGGAAPGGGVFSESFLGSGDVNDTGHAAFVFVLDPFTLPLGANGGLYRATPNGALEPVVVPEVTAAPGGGVFSGASFSPQLNNRRQIAFTGIVHGADISAGPPGIDGSGLGSGVFLANARGRIFVVARPGDPAPGGGIFDVASVPSINDRGDVAFGAHVAGEECLTIVPQAVRISCVADTYVRIAATGKIKPVARQGGPLPGGETCRATRGRVLNNRGEVAFGCDLTPPPDLSELIGLYLYAKGETIPVARPGDPMPGGANLLVAGIADQFHLNNAGRVIFVATLDTGEHGLYVWSRTSLHVVARTGTAIPGVGTVVELGPPDLVGSGSGPFAIGANDRGQIVFTAAVDDGGASLKGVLLVATRLDEEDDEEED